MARYSLAFKKSVSRDLAPLPKKDVAAVLRAIDGLAENPRPAQSKKLSKDEKYRLRCGTYRILYEIDDARIVVCVVKVGHRRDVYR